MKSPADMNVIQIDLTNACFHSCSNCTRMCGHHKKPYFMTFETFKRALDSLDGFPHFAGIMGGEPTMNPDFERICDYIRQHRTKKSWTQARKPIYSMDHYWHEHMKQTPDDEPEMDMTALWSAIGSDYYRKFETIQETFKIQLINDHRNAAMHQALLMGRKELGIPDQEWIEKRDNCWIQNTWSASITPKGAFFCEVAGALDMLFDGPGGWPIEKGWWKRKPEDFKDQLHWCEMCSLCIDVPKRLSNDERDDVTPEIYKKLIEVGSPKAKRGMCVVHNQDEYEKIKDPTFTQANDYMARDSKGNRRTTNENRSLYPKSVFKTDLKNWKEDVKKNEPGDWIMISLSGAMNASDWLTSTFILNPGCVYYNQEYILFNVLARSVRDYIRWPQIMNSDVREHYPKDKRIEVTQSMVAELRKDIEEEDARVSK